MDRNIYQRHIRVLGIYYFVILIFHLRPSSTAAQMILINGAAFEASNSDACAGRRARATLGMTTHDKDRHSLDILY